MNDFHYRADQLWCEDVPVREIAEKIGTPFYLYSSKTLKNHFSVFDQAFAAVPHIICFSVKSNSNIAVLRLFIKEGGSVDIVFISYAKEKVMAILCGVKKYRPF